MALSSDQNRIAARYAKALLGLADTAKLQDKLADDLQSLNSMVHSSADLARAFSSPVISPDQLVGTVQALAKKAGFDKLTTQFLEKLAKSRRLPIIAAILANFEAQLRAARGESLAVVKVAEPLSKENEKAIQAALNKAAGAAGRTGDVRLNVIEDPSLIGGFQVRMGSQMVDASVRSKLERLKLAMKGA